MRDMHEGRTPNLSYSASYTQPPSSITCSQVPLPCPRAAAEGQATLLNCFLQYLLSMRAPRLELLYKFVAKRSQFLWKELRIYQLQDLLLPPGTISEAGLWS